MAPRANGEAISFFPRGEFSEPVGTDPQAGITEKLPGFVIPCGVLLPGRRESQRGQAGGGLFGALRSDYQGALHSHEAAIERRHHFNRSESS